MEIDPLDTIEKVDESRPGDRAAMRLNTVVAITVAILATFMGLCKVKDDNIVQNMQQAQANKLDHWAYYQARNIREEIAKATLMQLRLSATTGSPADHARYQPAIDAYEKMATEQSKKKDELKALAEQDQKNYDAINFRDDQFDLSDALIAISISLLAVTALTQKRWLYLIALIPTGFGILMGLSGLFEWSIHPTILVRLLS
ncbi:MAG: DUF4337 domain-containing protein [Deltaproteobacteria bacterium]|nr:DUF4337 domain-containing protein [Deltaproteobacteria bacterium]